MDTDQFIKYRIEPAAIAMYPGVSRPIWFLDRVLRDKRGKISTSNICSGSEDYCIKTRNTLIRQEQEHKKLLEKIRTFGDGINQDLLDAADELKRYSTNSS